MTRAQVRQVVAVGLLVAVAVVTVLFVPRSRDTTVTPQGASAAAPRRVAVRTPQRKTIRRVVRVVADVLPWADVTVYARATGYVRTLAVDVGSRVAAGDVIAELDVPELEAGALAATASVTKARSAVAEARSAEVVSRAGLREAAEATRQAEADVERSRAELSLRETTRGRVEAVVASSPNLVARETLDEAQAEAAIAAARLRQADASRDLSKARAEAAEARAAAAAAAIDSALANVAVAESSLTQSNAALGFSRITAPFAGVVMERWVDLGALVRSGSSGSGTAIVRIVDPSKLRIRFHVAEPDAPFVEPGSPFRLTVDELPGREFAGVVARSAGGLDTDTRTMAVEGDLTNAEELLRPGMLGRVALELEEHADALVVPAVAVTTVKRKSSVFVVKDGKVVKRAITAGVDDGLEIEVLGGLAEGDQVVTTGASLVAEGDAAEAVPEAAQ